LDSGCTHAEGPYGGGGGSAFTELLDDCEATVISGRVRHGKYIDGIQLTYQYANGQHHTGGSYGGTGGSESTFDIDVDGGERITTILGRSGRYVDRLQFITNTGRVIGPFGGSGGSAFTASDCELHGIFGRSGRYLDAIGFYCTRP